MSRWLGRFGLLLCAAVWTAGCGVDPPGMGTDGPGGSDLDDPPAGSDAGSSPVARAGAGGMLAGAGSGGQTPSADGDLMFWNRIESQYGYETEIAFGHIAGQSEQRVYMCESNSPTAGLYKGTRVRPDLIRWDSEHDLPDYKVVMMGTDRMTFVPQVAEETFLGKFAPGTWHPGKCDFELNQDGELIDSSRYGYIYAGVLHGLSLQSVTIGGVRVPTGSSPDDCRVAVKLPRPAEGVGPLTVFATISGVGLDGPYTRTEESALYFQSLSAGCNRIVADDATCPSRSVCFAANNGQLPVTAQLEPTPVGPVGAFFEGIEVDDSHLYYLVPPSIWQCGLTGCEASSEEIVKAPCCDESCSNRCPFADTAQQYRDLALAGTKLFATKMGANGNGIDWCDLSAPSCDMQMFLSVDDVNDAPWLPWAANGRLYWLVSTGENMYDAMGNNQPKEIHSCPVSGCSGSPSVVYSGSLLDRAGPNGLVVSATDIFVLSDYGKLYRIPLLDADHADAAHAETLLDQLYMPKALDLDGDTLRWMISGGYGKVQSCKVPACDTIEEVLDTGNGPFMRTNSDHVYLGGARYAK